jgi:hypothetical protein
MEITDIKIPFWRLVVIFVKWAIAAIPAAIILTLLGWLLTAMILSLLFPGGPLRPF